MVMYQKICTRGRTVYRLRPVLLRRPVGYVDAAALPPWGWCSVCGKEVFQPSQQLCDSCRAALTGGVLLS